MAHMEIKRYMVHLAPLCLTPTLNTGVHTFRGSNLSACPHRTQVAELSPRVRARATHADPAAGCVSRCAPCSRDFPAAPTAVAAPPAEFPLPATSGDDVNSLFCDAGACNPSMAARAGASGSDDGGGGGLGGGSNGGCDGGAVDGGGGALGGGSRGPPPEPYTLRAVSHSLGGHAMLIYAVSRGRPGVSHAGCLELASVQHWQACPVP
eukprot:356018-Chlamydomonas_euryale.AAC.3